MCLAVPGEIIELAEPPDGELRTGRVSFGGVTKPVCLACVPEAGIGDFVLVHAGFAIAQISRAHAREALAYLAQIDPDGPGGPDAPDDPGGPDGGDA
jgi:hydrogenase expression/formation protein HypC